jgi:hypothetical protein
MFRMPRTGSPWREPPTVIESLSFERGTLDRHPHAFLLPNARVQEATARSLLCGAGKCKASLLFSCSCRPFYSV